MKQPVPVDIANDNDKPEDHLATATAALHKAMQGLGASAELLGAALSPSKPAKPQISN